MMTSIIARRTSAAWSRGSRLFQDQSRCLATASTTTSRSEPSLTGRTWQPNQAVPSSKQWMLAAETGRCSPLHYRHFSTVPDRVRQLPVKILYASQGGTAQIFAAQLSEALEEISDPPEVSIVGVHEEPPEDLLKPKEAMHIFLASVTGVGEPPDNARKFHAWLMDQPGGKDDMKGLDYTVFGLGNEKAHPNHYNVIGKAIDKKLDEMGAERVYPLGLGDDGECIEDDFDTWMEGLVGAIYTGEGADEASEPETPTEKPAQVEQQGDPDVTLVTCDGAKDPSGQRRVTSKYPLLTLKPSGTDVVCEDLFHLKDNSFYQEGTVKMPIMHNRPLNPNAGENGMYELCVSIAQHPNLSYDAGDHVQVYPRNSLAMVEGYLNALDVKPHTLIEPSQAGASKSSYPHPTGITLSETLSHCVDLSATPSPKFTRMILQRKDVDYKNDIAMPRRTVLDLLADAPRKLTLEELLYNLPPLRPRYYSIASSSLVHPDQIYLTYRPVQYLTNRGALRLGLSTYYMVNTVGAEDSENKKLTCSDLVGVIKPNPTFRLPADRKTPILMIAGGCGIAPIRSFLEERMHHAKDGPFGEGYLFLGFRSPDDAPYKELIKEAFQCGAISNVHVTYGSGCTGAVTSLQDDDVVIHSSCGMVSEALGDHSEQLYSFFERGGQTFICGGARNFGVAVENEVHALLQKHGNLSEEEATKYLQKLLSDGRFHEDLSD